MSFFKKGDLVEILDTPDIREWPKGIQAIGKRFILTEDDATRLNKNEDVHFSENQYKINFKTKHLKIIKGQFKKGQYIVNISKNDADLITFPKDFIFKQREDYDYLRPVIDHKGYTTNGWPGCAFNDKNSWRMATGEEILEYEKIGKPFDVKVMGKILGIFNIDDIVVSLTDNGNSRSKGDLFKILPQSSANQLYYEKNTFSPDVINWRLATEEEKDLYLSGVRNIHSVKSWVPKIGEWVLARSNISSEEEIGQVTRVKEPLDIGYNSMVRIDGSNLWANIIRKALPHEIPGESFGIIPEKDISIEKSKEDVQKSKKEEEWCIKGCKRFLEYGKQIVDGGYAKTNVNGGQTDYYYWFVKALSNGREDWNFDSRKPHGRRVITFEEFERIHTNKQTFQKKPRNVSSNLSEYEQKPIIIQNKKRKPKLVTINKK